MLAPAVQIMQHVWKGEATVSSRAVQMQHSLSSGVAWVTDSIEHDDEGDGENGTTRSGELGDAVSDAAIRLARFLSAVASV